MMTSPQRAVAALAAVGLSVLLLMGCAATSPDHVSSPPGDETNEQEPAADEQKTNEQNASSQSASHATVAVAGREFTFALDTCVVYDDTELSIAGSGGETGTDIPSYLDGDIMSLGPDALGEMRFDIGADGPFQTTDTFIAFGAPTGDSGFSVVAEGDGYTATGPAWDENGADLGMATARLICG